MISKEELQKKINSMPYWYHKIDLPYDITTPGWAPIDPGSYKIPEDLSGKRVLDIGSWDGYWAFEAVKRGAEEVIAIDDFSDYMGKLDQDDRKAWGTFDLCKEALDIPDKILSRIEMSVYDITRDFFGSFDIVFFFGTLYHLRYPLFALDKISSICTSTLFIESAILDDFSPYQGGINRGYPGQQMVMEFYPGKEYGKNDSNWWSPTLMCLMGMAQASGFINVEAWKLTDKPDKLPLCRGFVKAQK